MAEFYLTLRAMQDLQEIEIFSQQQWGQQRTSDYMSSLYDAFKKISENPQIGQLRLQRSFPFFMAPAEKHFAVYMLSSDDAIIIATVLHGRRDIEAILDRIGSSLCAEILELLNNNDAD